MREPLIQPIVDTVKTLDQVQQALLRADRTKDPELRKDAESVLSALVLVLKHRQARLPAGVGKSLERISVSI